MVAYSLRTFHCSRNNTLVMAMVANNLLSVCLFADETIRINFSRLPKMRILLAATTLLLLGPYGFAMPLKSNTMEDLSNLRGLQTNTTVPEADAANTTIAESKATNEGVVGDACCEGEKLRCSRSNTLDSPAVMLRTTPRM